MKMKTSRLLPLLACAFALLPSQATRAEVRPGSIHVAGGKKTDAYVKDGLILGGDRAMDDVAVKDIRRATNAGFERVVIDLEASQTSHAAAISRPPYYQVAVMPDESRILFTIWGRPRLDFDSKRVVAAFKKSALVKNLVLIPRVEEDTWTFALELRGAKAIEVFELSSPVRLIMDIKN